MEILKTQNLSNNTLLNCWHNKGNNIFIVNSKLVKVHELAFYPKFRLNKMTQFCALDVSMYQREQCQNHQYGWSTLNLIIDSRLKKTMKDLKVPFGFFQKVLTVQLLLCLWLLRSLAVWRQGWCRLTGTQRWYWSHTRPGQTRGI